MSDTNEIRELVTLPIIRVSEYYDEVVERASEDYDPYWYLCDTEEDFVTDERELERFDWKYEA
tara:strand:+ start:170 stop:358 length:189 start_codon:yes stop_codon:yes gene_type:complete